MRRRIGLQVITGVALTTALVVGVMAVLIVRAQKRQMAFELTRGANQLSETVLSSIHYDMLENRRESLHRQIVTIGRQEGIERVRLFNKDGRIMFSSDADETGRLLDKKAEACYVCHAEGRPMTKLPMQARARTFTQGGHRVLGIINPIPNESSCSSAACHAHTPDQSILGVLDVTVTMAEADAEIARSRVRIAVLAALAIVASSLLLWWLTRRLVLRPVRMLVAGTRRIAEGDLTATIPVTAKHELGDLARAFNRMTQKLAETQRQLTQADKLASVGRLAAGVAHEINNPLTGVLTYASLLEGRTQDPEAKDDLAVVVRETKRCREIVKALLDFARPSPPHPVPTDLNEVVRRAAAVALKHLTMEHVELALDLAPDLPPASADANQMQQVAVNLLLNAADAIGPGGGRIRIATRAASVAPWGHTPIRRAVCPRGCDLLDIEARIGGLPGIRVFRSCRGRESIVHLDPVYGRFHHLTTEPCDDGSVAVYACAACRHPLEAEGVKCDRCGAAVFAVGTPDDGPVRWCARAGCHGSWWPGRDSKGEEAVIQLSVEDTGRGISPEDLPRLFEPFFSTKGTRGTGLGLAVTWGIVEAHGGTIEVETVSGKGSLFTVRLPLAPSVRPPQPALEEAVLLAASGTGREERRP